MGRPPVESLGSDAWQLHRSPLRAEGATQAPALPLGEAMGEVAVPGNLQLQLKFADPWLDIPELTNAQPLRMAVQPARSTTPEHAGDGRAFLTFAGVDYFTRRLAQRPARRATTRARSPGGSAT